MTPEQLAEIEARAAAATPGPWGICPYHPDEIQPAGKAYCCFSTGEIIADICKNYTDATFIINARIDIPNLLAEIKRLQAACHDAYGFIEYLYCHDKNYPEAKTFLTKLEAVIEVDR